MDRYFAKKSSLPPKIFKKNTPTNLGNSPKFCIVVTSCCHYSLKPFTSLYYTHFKKSATILLLVSLSKTIDAQRF